MHTFPNLIQYVTIKQIYKDCLNFTYLDKLSWLLRKSGLVKKVTGLNIFQGDQPWAGQLQNTLPCLIRMHLNNLLNGEQYCFFTTY